jgi:heme exporter protein D
MRIAAVAALLLLVVATILAVHKARGMTGYGRRKQREQRGAQAQAPGSRRNVFRSAEKSE